MDWIQNRKKTYTTSQGERLNRQVAAESGGDPNIVSPKGATGILQIMPNAYQDYVKSTGDMEPFESVKNPDKARKVRDWLVNDIANAEFIKGKSKSPLTNLAKIYGSYNWGRGNMVDFLNDAKKRGYDISNGIKWINDSKFPAETRDYINKILLRNNPQFEKDFNGKTFYKQSGGTIPKAQNGNKLSLRTEPKRDWLKDFIKEKFSKVSAVAEAMSVLPGTINPINAIQGAADITGFPGVVNAVAGNPMHLPQHELEGSMMPIVGNTSKITMGLEGMIKPKNSRQMYYMMKNQPERQLTKNEVDFLQNELNTKGVLDQQKTSWFPFKNKISSVINNSFDPHGYDAGEKLFDIKRYLTEGKQYRANIKASKDRIMGDYVKRGIEIDPGGNATNFANRASVWDTYLGNSRGGLAHQPLEISGLSTTKNPVYRIKEDRLDPYQFFRDGENGYMRSNPITNPITKGYTYRVQDRDNYADIMGGFGWDVKKLLNGNKKYLATDVWDLHPLKDITNVPNWMRSESGGLIKKFWQKPMNILQNIEVGKFTGLGKPIDIRTGFIYDPKIGEIIKRF